MKKIKDIDCYIKRMGKSMQDKLFFLEELKEIYEDNSYRSIVFVDFGCGDGSLIEAVNGAFPFSLITYIGIDNSEEMKKMFKEKHPNKLFFSSLEDFYKEYVHRKDYILTILNLSSVLHEVHHYLPEDEVNKFYKQLSFFDYLFIRDMYYKDYDSTIDNMVLYFAIQVVPQKEFRKKKNQFIDAFGSIASEKNATHFLMKFMYDENWDRECTENYFADIKFDMIEKKFHTLYFRHYQLPYFKKLWKGTFNVRTNTKTHIQAIYKKKEEDF